MAASFATPVTQPYGYQAQLPLELMGQVADRKQKRFDLGMAQAQDAYGQLLSLPADVGYDTQRRNEIVGRVQEQLNNLGAMDYSSPEAQAKVNSIISAATADGQLAEIASNQAYARQLEDEMEERQKKGENISPYNMAAYEQLQGYRNQPATGSERLGRGRIYANFDTSKFATDIGDKVKADLTKQLETDGRYDTTELREYITQEKVADAIYGAATQDSRVMGDMMRRFQYENRGRSLSDLYGDYAAASTGRIGQDIGLLAEQKRQNPKAAPEIDARIGQLQAEKAQWEQMDAMEREGKLSDGQKQSLLFGNYLRGYASDFGRIFAKDRLETDRKANAYGLEATRQRNRLDLDSTRRARKKADDAEQQQMSPPDNWQPGYNENRPLTGFLGDDQIRLDGNGDIVVPKSTEIGVGMDFSKLTDNPVDLLPFGYKPDPKAKEKMEYVVQQYVMSVPELKRQWEENPQEHGRIRKQVVPLINQSLTEYSNSFNRVLPVSERFKGSRDYFREVEKNVKKGIGLGSSRVFRLDEQSGAMVELSAKQKEKLNQAVQKRGTNTVMNGVYGPRNTIGIGSGFQVAVSSPEDSDMGGKYVVEDNRQLENAYLVPAQKAYAQQFSKDEKTPIPAGYTTTTPSGARAAVYYRKARGGITANPQTGGAVPYAQYVMELRYTDPKTGQPRTDYHRDAQGNVLSYSPEQIEQAQTELYYSEAGRRESYSPKRGTGGYNADSYGDDGGLEDDGD